MTPTFPVYGTPKSSGNNSAKQSKAEVIEELDQPLAEDQKASPPTDLEAVENDADEVDTLALHHGMVSQFKFLKSEIPEDVFTKVINTLPIRDKDSLSLVSKDDRAIVKKNFLETLRSLPIPEVRKHIADGIGLFDIAEMMGLRNNAELAHYLAKQVLGPKATKTGEEGRFAEAFSMLTDLAREGCPTAQYELGKLLVKEANGVQKDHELGLFWLSTAAENSADACNELTRIYLHGQYDPQLHDEAAKWAKQGIRLNSGLAYTNLGHMYEIGLGSIPQNPDEAMKYYRQGAERGCASAFHYLGRMYERGWGENIRATCNLRLAMENYESYRQLNRNNKLADFPLLILGAQLDRDCMSEKDEKPYAAYYAGLLYINGWGHVEKDEPEGIHYLKLAHRMGHGEAMLALGEWYFKKHQCEVKKAGGAPSDDPFLSEAIVCMEHAVAIGHPEALYTLGTWYQMSPSKADQEKAQDYFMQAVIRDKHKQAAEKVADAMLLRAAEHISEKNYDAAYEIYSPLAGIGNPEAHLQLAVMYMKGWRITTDEQLIPYHLEQAAKQEHAYAAFVLANWQMRDGRSKHNTQQAIKWYEEASVLRHAESSFRAGMMHTDRDQKIKFLTRAYRQGYVNAAYALGMLYVKLDTFTFYFKEADLIEARKWFKVAAAFKVENAGEKLAEVEGILNSGLRVKK